MEVILNLFIFLGLFLVIYGYSLNLNRNKDYGKKCKTIYVKEKDKSALSNITNELQSEYLNETRVKDEYKDYVRNNPGASMRDFTRNRVDNQLTDKQKELVKLFQDKDLTPEQIESFRHYFIYNGPLFTG